MKAESFIQDWLDKAVGPVLLDTYAGERRRWKDGRPEGADSDEPAVSVEAIEFQLTDSQAMHGASALFADLEDAQRSRLVFEALKRLVDVGKAVRLPSPEDEIADQLFKPANLLDSIAYAAR